MADVFISYSRADLAVVKALAEDLADRGVSVWWDRDLDANDPFQKVIRAEIAAAKAAIVLWTPTSVKSDWVYAETTLADQERGKLIPIRMESVRESDVPAPYLTRHMLLAGDRDALEAALRRRGIILAPRDRSEDEAEPDPGGTRRRVFALAAGGLLAGAGGLAYYLTRPPAPVVWSELPRGTRLVNHTAQAVPTFTAADRTSGRNLSLAPGRIVPEKDVDDPIWRARIGGESWLRFPAGGGEFAHVPEAEVELRLPKPRV